MKNNVQPRIDTLAQNYISRGQIYLAVLNQNKGVSYSVLVQSRLPKSLPKPIIRTVSITQVIIHMRFHLRIPLVNDALHIACPFTFCSITQAV